MHKEKPRRPLAGLALPLWRSAIVVASASAGSVVHRGRLLRGTAAADKLYGNSGNDKLYGLAGNGYLNGGPGMTSSGGQVQTSWPAGRADTASRTRGQSAPTAKRCRSPKAGPGRYRRLARRATRNAARASRSRLRTGLAGERRLRDRERSRLHRDPARLSHPARRARQ
jgi:hypothetical protein